VAIGPQGHGGPASTYLLLLMILTLVGSGTAISPSPPAGQKLGAERVLGNASSSTENFLLSLSSLAALSAA
jgi:hypothetical protein